MPKMTGMNLHPNGAQNATARPESEISPWRDVPQFPGYRITSEGSVESIRNKTESWRSLRPKRGTGDYLKVTLRRDGKSFCRDIHRLVLEAFVGTRPEGMVCRHIDGNPLNNRVSNLTWGTHQENMDDKIRHKKTNVGERNPGAILSEAEVFSVLCWSKAGLENRDLATKFNISPSTIRDIVSRRKWKHVADPLPIQVRLETGVTTRIPKKKRQAFSDDVPSRLRKWAKSLNREFPGTLNDYAALLRDAATEIETLRTFASGRKR